MWLIPLFVLLFLLILYSIQLLKSYFAINIQPPLVSDLLKGKNGLVISPISPNSITPGKVKLDGEVWCAISKSNTPILTGTSVLIEEIKGVYLIVSESMD